jgi:predicted NBD/HSP70 family sugar kinase
MLMADNASLFALNATRVLRLIRRNPGISRIMAAERLGLDRSTLSKLSAALIAKGFIREAGKAERREGLGRTPLGLELEPGVGAVLGLEVETGAVRASIVDFSGEVILESARPRSGKAGSIAGIAIQATEEARAWLRERGLKLLGLSLGLSGLVDSRCGILLRSNPLGVRAPIALARELAGSLGFETMVENDARACAWGDIATRPGARSGVAVLGELRPTDSEWHREMGVAVGLGIVLRGKLVHGPGFSAGEFKSLLWKEGNLSQFSLSNEEIGRLASDESLKRRLFDELALNLALIVNCLNLREAVLAGWLASGVEGFRAAMARELERNWLYEGAPDFSVRASKAGEFAVARGAALRFIERFFSLPGLPKAMRGNSGLEFIERCIAGL